MKFEDSLESIAIQFGDMAKARGIQATAFPARRSDEKGWHIGHTVKVGDAPTTITHQIHIEIPPAFWPLPDDYLNYLLDYLPTNTPVVTVLAPRMTADFKRADQVCHGIHCRFLLMPSTGGIRIDVLFGARANG